MEGALLDLGSGPRDSPRAGNEVIASQELFNSFSSATAKIPNYALLSEWNKDSKSSFKYYKLPKIMPGNNDISQLDSLLPALNIKQKKTEENFLVLFLTRLGNLTLWFPLDHENIP